MLLLASRRRGAVCHGVIGARPLRLSPSLLHQQLRKQLNADDLRHLMQGKCDKGLRAISTG